MPVNAERYELARARKNGSVAAYRRGCRLRRLSRRVDSIGVRVRATKDEISTAPARVSPNSRNSRPTSPPRNMIGMKTATRATVVATTAKKISRVPSMPASVGSRPASILA